MASEIIEKVKSLYEIMKEEKIQELEVELEGYKIYIKRKDYSDECNNDQIITTSKKTAEQKFLNSQNSQREEFTTSLTETINSPIMGVFYRSPSPSSAAFAKEGDIIEAGKTICIIEAMKVMNEIKTTFKAKILRILVENGKQVNLNQVLFEVERA
jgi:acetyl-CoA carboxylase biotin carboxyl carrier protein